jgi:hypothetical protein
MLMVRSLDEAAVPRAEVVPEPGLLTWVTRYFGADVGDLYASAHIVEMAPSTTGGAHYHACDQFQVVVGGSGFYGKQHVEPVTVHFSRAFSPYGPITSEAHGLTWFTLRNGKDPGGIKWMPAFRDQLRAEGRKPLVVYGKSDIVPQEDGLAAVRYVLAPQAGLTGISPATGRGQYWIVLGGAGTLCGTLFGEPHGLVFVGPEEAPMDVVAGPTGLEVLCVQFPR